MKTLTASMTTAVDKPHVAPIGLLEIELTSPSSLTVYLSTRPFDSQNTIGSAGSGGSADETELPDGDVTTDWTPVGAANHYDCIKAGVDTPDDTKYVTSAAVKTDEWTVATPGTADTCTAMKLRWRSLESMAYNCDIRWSLWHGGVQIGDYYTDNNHSVMPPIWTNGYNTWSGLSLAAADLDDITVRCENMTGSTASISEVELVFMYGGTASTEVTYDPLMVDVGPIRMGEIDPVSYDVGVGEMTITIDNTVPVGGYDTFSKLLAAFDWAYSTVSYYLIEEDATAVTDKTLLFKGKLENLDAMDQQACTLTVSDMMLAYMAKWPHIIVDSATYPYASPEALGQMLPQCWGTCKRVPFVPVVLKMINTLGADLAAGATTMYLGDADELARIGTPPGFVWIEEEKIEYDGIDTANVALTGLTRDFAGTGNDVDHQKGALVLEHGSSIYIIGHPCKAIDHVYLKTVSGQWVEETSAGIVSNPDGNTYPGYAEIGVGWYEVWLKRKLDLEISNTLGISNTLAVDDGIGVTDAISVSDNIAVSSAVTTLEDYPSGSSGTGVYSDLTNAYDGNETTYAEVGTIGGGAGSITLTWPSTNLGTISDIKVFLLLLQGDANDDITVSSTKGTVTPSTCKPASSDPAWFRFDVNATAWGLDVTVSADLVGNEMCRVYEAKAVITYSPTQTKSGSASKAGSVTKTGAAALTGSVSLTGDVTLIGSLVSEAIISQVVADIDGYEDDASGTYTGTANALIERPDAIFTHWIVAMLGLTTSNIHSASYAAAKALYTAAGYTLGVCLLEPPNIKDQFVSAAKQAKSIQFWEGGEHHLLFLEDSPSVADVVSGHRIDLGGLTLNYTLRATLKNILKATYDRQWAIEEVDGNRAIVTSTDSASVTKYGSLRLDLPFDYVSVAAQAQDIIDFMLNDLDDPRLEVNLTGDLSLVPWERGDIMGFDLALYEADSWIDPDEWLDTDSWLATWSWAATHGVAKTNLLAALLGFVTRSDHAFRVIDKVYMPGFRIQMKAVEI